MKVLKLGDVEWLPTWTELEQLKRLAWAVACVLEAMPGSK